MLAFRNILCPVDFSEDSELAVRQIAKLTEGQKAKVELLHVVEPIVYPVEYGIGRVPSIDLEATIAEKAGEKLTELASHLPDLEVTTRVEFGAPWRRICDLAEEGGFDLVVLATHGLTGLKHLLLGSVAERVVCHAPCPVLTVKRSDHEKGNE